MNFNDKIFVAGHRGIVGSALLRKLQSDGYTNIITRTHTELDLTRQTDVEKFFSIEKPEYIFLVAANVGGIGYLTEHRYDVFSDNCLIANNVIRTAKTSDVIKLLFVAAGNIYPENAPQPVTEDSLLTGKFNAELEPYGLSKVIGVKLCQYSNEQYNTNFISVAPVNLYGSGDKHDLKVAGVLPSLIKKFAQATHDNSSSVDIWGTGNARREFLHVDDFADACVFLMNQYSGSEVVNVGSGSDVSIRELAELLKNISGYNGKLVFDSTKPEGVMRRVTNCSKLFDMGWKPRFEFEQSIRSLYQDYVRGIL